MLSHSAVSSYKELAMIEDFMLGVDKPTLGPASSHTYCGGRGESRADYELRMLSVFRFIIRSIKP